MQATLDRLTTRHPIDVQRDDGTLHEDVYADALIKQLRDAIQGEDGRNGGGSGMKSKLPLSQPALDLYDAIDARITEVWVQRFQRVPGLQHPEELLREWAADLPMDRFVIHNVKYTVPTSTGGRVEQKPISTTVLGFLMQIEQEITTLLERPTTQVPVAGPCPATGCHATTFVQYDEMLEMVESPTLEFTREQRTGRTLAVSCRTCGASWDDSRFREFAEAMGALERARSVV